MSTSTTTSTEDRALTLLGQNIPPSMVASALGVTVSRISQLISDENFSAAVAELRYKNLLRHNKADSAYDTMEEKLQEKLADLIPFMMKPFEVLKAIQIINSAKRRGAEQKDFSTDRSQVVQLLLPVSVYNQHVVQNIQVNVNNQVTKAGDQELITVQSSQMDKMLEKQRAISPRKELPYVHPESSRTDPVIQGG